MKHVVGRVVWFDVECGEARMSYGQRVFLHENQRVHPYATDRIFYATSVPRGNRIRGLLVRMRIARSEEGFVALSWMIESDFRRARRKAQQKRQQCIRRRNPRKASQASA